MSTLLALLLILQGEQDPAAGLREMESRVLAEPLPRMLTQDADRRLRDANRRESDAWSRIATKEDWERYKGPRVRALRESLGAADAIPGTLQVRVTKTLEGRGH